MTRHVPFPGRVRHLLVVSGVGLLGAIGLAACGPGEDTGTDTESPGPDEWTEDPVAFGDSAELEEWTVEIGEVEFDAAEQLEDYEDFNRDPEAGRTFILVTITATYNGEGSHEIDRTFDRTLWDGADQVGDDLTDMHIPEPLDRAGPVRHGSTASGNVVFEAPGGDYADMLLEIETAGERHYFELT